jgi:protein-S-isoprenylcysteine O-methyltransferase Ste14
LGAEHPLCDKIQLLLLILFLGIWSVDYLSYFISGYSTVIFQALNFPLLFLGMALFLILSFYLISESHKAVFEQTPYPPKLVDSGVYGWVRHPMYLGILLFCLAFLFISVSLFSIAVLIIFVIFYDIAASFEEKSLTKILGEQYILYQKRVSKWIPKVI